MQTVPGSKIKDKHSLLSSISPGITDIALKKERKKKREKKTTVKKISSNLLPRGKKVTCVNIMEVEGKYALEKHRQEKLHKTLVREGKLRC